MTSVIVDLVLVLWVLLFGGMALLPLLTGGHGRATHEPEDRVISIAPARNAPAGGVGARVPLVPDADHRDRPAA